MYLISLAWMAIIKIMTIVSTGNGMDTQEGAGVQRQHHFKQDSILLFYRITCEMMVSWWPSQDMPILTKMPR